MQSDVVITGYRLNAKEPAQKALERILGLSPDAARTLARNFPAVVLQGAANDNAQRICAQLAEAGAQVELRPSGSAAGRTAAAAAARPAAVAAGRPTAAERPAARPVMDAFADDLEQGSLPPARAGGGPLAAPSPPRQHGPELSSHTPAAHARDPGSLEAPRASPPAPRANQATGRTRAAGQPPPPPLAAYQLGDFGMTPRGQSVVAKLPTAPPELSPLVPSAPPAPSHTGASAELSDGNFELDTAGGLELDLAIPMRTGMPLQPSAGANHDMNLHEPIEELAPRGRTSGGDARPRSPDVDQVAYRAIQHRGRVDSRRPVKKRSLLDRIGSSPLPSLLMLLGVCGITLVAVGYALDPEDPIGGLARAQAPALDDGRDEVTRKDGSLHPLLRATPRTVRAPLAAILRARITGVHDVPVNFPARGSQTAQCSLVEHKPGETEARLAKVRETGHEVAAPVSASSELIEHEQVLRTTLGRPDLMFTRVCLVP